jgi:hypothetical protein
VLFLLGRTLNLLRLVLNNFAAGKDYWGSSNHFRPTVFGFRLDINASAIDPASLTELGKQYRRKAIRNERIMFACLFGGVILVVRASSYLS